MGIMDKLTGLYEKHGRDFKSGSVIFLEGSHGETMFVVLEGQVEISKTYKETEMVKKTRLVLGSNTQVLAILKPGDFFGEMALLNERERSASARALDDVKLIEITKDNLDSLFNDTNPIVLQIMKSLSNRLRDTNRHPRLIFEEKKSKSRTEKKSTPKKTEEKKPGRVEPDEKKKKKEKGEVSPADGVTTAREKTCDKCGDILPRRARYCMQCGAEL